MAMIVLFGASCLCGLSAYVIFHTVRGYHARHDQADDQLSQRMIDFSGFVKVNSPQV